MNTEEANIQIIDQDNIITRSDLKQIAEEIFGDMVKAVIDIEKKVMAIGGELHADEEALLLEEGSVQQNLWGINLYPDETGEDFIEFDSMINIRPKQDNRSRDIENEDIKEKITEVVNLLVKDE